MTKVHNEQEILVFNLSGPLVEKICSDAISELPQTYTFLLINIHTLVYLFQDKIGVLVALYLKSSLAPP